MDRMVSGRPKRGIAHATTKPRVRKSRAPGSKLVEAQVAGAFRVLENAGALRFRADAALPMDAAAALDRPLLFDTTVYLDRGAGRLPPTIHALIEAKQHQVNHSGVVCAKLAISIGILDPSDPRTPRTIAVILAHLHQMGVASDVSLTGSARTEAAILAGMLART
jgi:hypothetical protein